MAATSTPSPAPAAAASPTAAPADWQVPRVLAHLSAAQVYGGAFGLWLLERLAVVAYQGTWPWMNESVVAGAADILRAGDWSTAIRPPLPSMLAVPFLALGLNELQAAGGLYLLASGLELGALLLALRQAFPARLHLQAVALVLLLLLPFNQAIHHWRNVPALLGATGVFLLAAHWLWATRQEDQRVLWSPRSLGWLLAGGVIGLWSRTEVATFVGALLLLGIITRRRAAAPLVAVYVLAMAAALLLLIGLGRVVGVEMEARLARYQVHTFFDSTPWSWLSPECQAAPTENCRDADGQRYFGPFDPDQGLLKLVLSRPWLTLAKTARSAFDNTWMMLGGDISTFPLLAWLVLGAAALSRPARDALWRLPAQVWVVCGAALAMTVLPPLSWAPPHAEYHAHVTLPVLLVGAPVLAALWASFVGRRLVLLVLVAEALLSAFRYTRYPGY